MRSDAAAIAGLVIRMGSPQRYEIVWKRPQKRRAALRGDLSRRFRLGTVAKDKAEDEEKQVQERTEIDFLRAQPPHPSSVKKGQTEGPSHNCQLPPPPEQE